MEYIIYKYKIIILHQLHLDKEDQIAFHQRHKIHERITQKKDCLALQFQKVPVIVRLASMLAPCGEEAHHESHSPQKVEKEKL